MSAEENNTKAKGRGALLEMAKDWDKEGKTQHAIEAYEAVIEAGSESKEADRAREALLTIAHQFDKQGKRNSAYHLLHKMAEGRAGTHDHSSLDL